GPLGEGDERRDRLLAGRGERAQRKRGDVERPACATGALRLRRGQQQEHGNLSRQTRKGRGSEDPRPLNASIQDTSLAVPATMFRASPSSIETNPSLASATTFVPSACVIRTWPPARTASVGS